MPESADPPTKDSAQMPSNQGASPTPLSEAAYHDQADRYIDALVAAFEAKQETREDVDVEYSQGVCTLSFPPNGVYVLNKQPANKQIWLSSPVTGPKRFDWVVQGEGGMEKQGSGVGEWVYLRDGSTLTEILSKEVGVFVDPNAAEGGHS